MKKNLLRLPLGTETLYLEESFHHRKILRHLEDITERWGYLPIQTPVFDFYENYRPLLDAKLEGQSYKLIDRDGELLMLRSDITLFLARQMGLVLSEEELPLRVQYADSILRYQDHEDISSNEFFQAGCELMGKPGLEGDLEILMLLAVILKEFKLPLSRIHVGSSMLFRIPAEALSEKDGLKLKHYLHTREKDNIHKILGHAYGKQDAAALTELFLFIGSAREYCLELENWGKLLQGSLKESLNQLKDLADRWTSIKGFDDFFNIDLSETGNQAYYSGIVFSSYTEGCSTAIASGGRYDGLLNQFGYKGNKPVPSLGFSLFLGKLEQLSTLDVGQFPVKRDESHNIVEKVIEELAKSPCKKDTP